MRKETIFFLILTLTAAIITGCTLGTLSNIQYLAKNGKVPVLAAQKEQAATKSQVADNTSSSKSANTQQKSAESTTGSSSSSANTENMIMSPEETSQIRAMLVSLGMTEKSDYNQFVMQYQQAHGIRPTGNMDSMTLNSIIEEVRMQRIRQTVAR